MDTLSLFRDFARYTGWADAEVFAGIRKTPDTGKDESLLAKLRHSQMVQGAFLDVLEKKPFDPEATRSLDIAALEQFTITVHRRAESYYNSLTPEMLDTVIELPWARHFGEKLGFDVRKTTLAELLVQVFSHTTYHRGQVNARLRELGVKPAMVDFIAWVWANKPAAAWHGEGVTPEIVIRDETEDDIQAITDVTVKAFRTLEVSDQTEQFVIEALRAAGVLTLSIVAEKDGRVIGHIAFSPVTVSDGSRNWYGLGPVSVLPEHQRKGIGKALIGEGLSRLKELGANGCCLVGHPEYYRQFGFGNEPGLVHEGVPPEVFFTLSFDGRIPQGTVTFHEAFKAGGPQ